MSFDEQSLRRDIAETWGEHGAHVDVFDALVKSRAAVTDQKAALIEEIDRLRALITAWCDAYDADRATTIAHLFAVDPEMIGADPSDGDTYEAVVEAGKALRKAVGR